jgi:predicted transposase YdaD
LLQNHSKMAKAVQFINPFTDFGFKKLFGEEENKDLLKNLPDLEEVPELFQKGILAKVFKVADMANLTREERRAYEESVKQYRDLRNVTDTAFYDGKVEGKIEGFAEGAERTKWNGIKKAMRRGKLSDEEIAEDFEVSIEYVQQVRDTII